MTTLVRALQALHDGDAEAARVAAQDDPSLLGAALSRHLGRESRGSVYDQPAAFAAFIRGGGNVPLYADVSAALADLYDKLQPDTLLDVGCGDGSAILLALQAAQHRPTHIDLVEPSEPLLEAATTALHGWQQTTHSRTADQHLASPAPTVRTWAGTAQEFLGPQRDGQAGTHRWSLIESTFALHTLPYPDRNKVLRALRPRTDWLALVEFDVPAAAVGSPEHLEFLARTYEQGLAEYNEDREFVAQGFLMPVLTGQLRPGAVRAAFEQPANAWADQIRDAGFTDVTVRAVHNYWSSSPAFLITARGAAD